MVLAGFVNKASALVGVGTTDVEVDYRITSALDSKTGPPEEALIEAFSKMLYLLEATYDQELIIIVQDLSKVFLSASAGHFVDALRIGNILEVEGAKHGNFTSLVVSTEFRNFWSHSRDSAKTHPDRHELSKTIVVGLLYLAKVLQSDEAAEKMAVQSATDTVLAEAGKSRLFEDPVKKLGTILYVLGYSLQMAGKEAEEAHEKELAKAAKVQEKEAIRKFKQQQSKNARESAASLPTTSVPTTSVTTGESPAVAVQLAA